MFSAATKEAANDTIADAKSTAYSAKRDLRDVSTTNERDISGYAERAGKEVRHLVDSVNDQFHDATDAVKSEIRSNPLRSAGIALGAGVLLGLLIRR